MKFCPLQKQNKKHMQTSVNIQTETQMNGCLLYAIPCAYFWLCCCCCCGAQACMKWCALNMNEDQRQLNCFCDEYWLHFPWTNNPRGVRGSFFSYCYFAFLLLCALHLLCVCVPSVRGADTTDRSRRVCVRWSLVCRSCLLLPLPSVCWCCGSFVCVCACCRGLECVSCVVCGVRCMPGCCPLLMWCALCVCVCRTSRLPCCSPCPSLCRSAPHH
ncbi:hypothetical protein ECC02_012350 [Trypanosoma cruzi]|uniref:Mucin TcMUC n=1 Tax=Trypanosoma cruzi TaxID=5693 RepID=A0A7J6XKF1_TRYCR|nr:hypothetical protein ECC02_012350 [Trypanosoma cruzi]